MTPIISTTIIEPVLRGHSRNKWTVNVDSILWTTHVLHETVTLVLKLPGIWRALWWYGFRKT